MEEKKMTIKSVPKEMQERIIDMANKTWYAIGDDYLTDDMGRHQANKSIPRSEVAEAVSDADRMGTFGDDKEAYEYWRNIPDWSLRRKLVLNAFPLKRYGW